MRLVGIQGYALAVVLSPILAALPFGIPREYEEETRTLVFNPCLGAFRRALTGDTQTLVEPMCVTLKAGADLSRAKGNSRVYPPGERI